MAGRGSAMGLSLLAWRRRRLTQVAAEKNTSSNFQALWRNHCCSSEMYTVHLGLRSRHCPLGSVKYPGIKDFFFLTISQFFDVVTKINHRYVIRGSHHVVLTRRGCQLEAQENGAHLYQEHVVTVVCS